MNLHGMGCSRWAESSISRGYGYSNAMSALPSYCSSPEKTHLEAYDLETNAPPMPEEDRERRILTGVLTTIQEPQTTKDALSRLVRRHLAMPQLLIGVMSRHLDGLDRILYNKL